MGFFEQNAGLFFAIVAVVGGTSGYLGAKIHTYRAARSWTRR